MSLLRLENVVHRYREQRTGREFEALRVHELTVEPGEMVTVVGPNGSGKSTLLEILAFLTRPSSGRVLLDGQDVWDGGKALSARRECPILLQKSVLFSTSVLKNVAFGLRARGMARAEVTRRAYDALDRVGMRELAHRRHDELSGGERRRVALAQVLALEPRIVLLDEPSASLDHESERAIEDLIRSLNRDRGATVIMANHNFRQAVALSTRIVTLLDGKLVPETLDNVLFGTMRRTADGFEFIENGGWRHVFRPEDLAEDRWEGVGPVEGPVQVAIPSAELVLAETAETGALHGQIDALRKTGDVCRVRVRLDNGPNLSAELPLSRWNQLDLTLGTPVALTPNRGAVRVLPAQTARSG